MFVLALFLAVFPAAYSLTCYNGMKLVRMQSVGESVEECPSGAYCYNMTASAALIVDVVKAGCSTWRCMLARDKCISTTFQMVPVSLCCCSHDRCNVGGNPVFDQFIVPAYMSKRHESRAQLQCICVRIRNGALEAVVGTEVGPSQTAAMGGDSKGFTTLLAAALHRSVWREAAYAIACAFPTISVWPESLHIR
ncbi:hypothetical protein RB195_006504 [Necator americanus]|uniref:ET module n=1 Tax=Necator americanus TaxID=51031 RepID=A0ABR1BWA7_NECAM